MIDNSLSPVLADLLRLDGHDAIHVRKYDLQAAEDPVVFDRAAAEGRVLVSGDTDFSMLLATLKASQPSVILLRKGTPRQPQAQAVMLRLNLPSITEDLQKGSVLSFDRGRIRSRPLPVQP